MYSIMITRIILGNMKVFLHSVTKINKRVPVRTCACLYVILNAITTGRQQGCA